jgi:AcrR family transcriptional regulator
MGTSSVRHERAEKTRQRICAVAKELFLDRGYTATTITEIARNAGVAHQTVYFVFGSKAALLSAIMDTEIVGDFAPVPLLERPQVKQLARIADPYRRLARIVALTCEITERVAPVYELVRSGAADQEVRDLLDRAEEQRWRSIRGFLDFLDADLAPGLSADAAADRLYALLSHDLLWLLVRRRGWTAAQWRRYVAEQAPYQLFALSTTDEAPTLA